MRADILAEQFCHKYGNSLLVYAGADPVWNGTTGHVEVIEDMNCCAPTNNVLFGWTGDGRHKIMSGEDFIDFSKDLHPAKEKGNSQ